MRREEDRKRKRTDGRVEEAGPGRRGCDNDLDREMGVR